MRTISMLLISGIALFAFTSPAQAATTTNSYATATTRTSVDPQVRSNISRAALGSNCSSIFVGKDKMPIAVCTRILGQSPAVMLFDKTGKSLLATRPLARYSSSATIPAYLDQHGWLVLVNGDRVMWGLNHSQWDSGKWSIGLAQSADLTRTIDASDSVVGLQPDSAGHIWFATVGGVIGTADTVTNRVRSIRLKNAERIQQDISLSSSRVVVTSTRATYTLTAGTNGVPKILFRKAR